MATRTSMDHRPQHWTFVVSTDQTWLGYQAGMERDSAFSSVVFSGLAGAARVSRGFGRCRMFRTVEAERKMPSSFSWLAMRMRPQLRLALVISHTSVAISAGVLFAGAPEDSCSSIWCSQR